MAGLFQVQTIEIVWNDIKKHPIIKVPAFCHIPVALLLGAVYYLRQYEDLERNRRSSMTIEEIQLEGTQPDGVKAFIAVFLIAFFACSSTNQSFFAYVTVLAIIDQWQISQLLQNLRQHMY